MNAESRCDESLRIDSDEAWSAVTRRPDERTQRVGERVALGIEAAGVRHTARVGRYILGARDARRDMADLLGGQVHGVNDGGKPVVEVGLHEGALVAMCLGIKAPAYTGTGSGGVICAVPSIVRSIRVR